MEPFSLSFESLAILFVCALFGGFVDSIAGGGGIITLPALLAVGVPPHLALGTNKLQSSFGSFTASINYARGGMIQFGELFTGVIFTAIGALVGTLCVQSLSTTVLQQLIPFFLIGIFVYMLCNPTMGAESRVPKMDRKIFYIIFGCLLGFYDGFFGPGTGSFWTMAFTLCLGFDLTRATAHTKVLNFTSNVVALGAFLSGGYVILGAGLLMGAGQILGAYLGSHVVLKRGTKFVRIFFLTVVAVTIVKLFWSKYG